MIFTVRSKSSGGCLVNVLFVFELLAIALAPSAFAPACIRTSATSGTPHQQHHRNGVFPQFESLASMSAPSLTSIAAALGALGIEILCLFFFGSFSSHRETRDEKTTDKSTKRSDDGIIRVHQITGDHADDAEDCRAQDPYQFFVHLWKNFLRSVLRSGMSLSEAGKCYLMRPEKNHDQVSNSGPWPTRIGCDQTSMSSRRICRPPFVVPMQANSQWPVIPSSRH